LKVTPVHQAHPMFRGDAFQRKAPTSRVDSDFRVRQTASDRRPKTAVNQRTDEGSKEDLWEQRDQRGCGEDGRGTCLPRQIPYQCKLNERAAEEREGLSAPDGEEAGSPIVGNVVGLVLHFSSFL